MWTSSSRCMVIALHMVNTITKNKYTGKQNNEKQQEAAYFLEQLNVKLVVSSLRRMCFH